MIIGLPTPLLPIHLLWINLVTDGLPALCLATDPIDPDAMNRRPRHRLESITDRSFLRTMAFTGFLTAGVAFAVYFAGAFNLGLVIRHLIGVGTPRGLQGRFAAVLVAVVTFLRVMGRSLTALGASPRRSAAMGSFTASTTLLLNSAAPATCTTGC